jgi:hypothetical protein
MRVPRYFCLGFKQLIDIPPLQRRLTPLSFLYLPYNYAVTDQPTDTTEETSAHTRTLDVVDVDTPVQKRKNKGVFDGIKFYISLVFWMY